MREIYEDYQVAIKIAVAREPATRLEVAWSGLQTRGAVLAIRMALIKLAAKMNTDIAPEIKELDDALKILGEHFNELVGWTGDEQR